MVLDSSSTETLFHPMLQARVRGSWAQRSNRNWAQDLMKLGAGLAFSILVWIVVLRLSDQGLCADTGVSIQGFDAYWSQ